MVGGLETEQESKALQQLHTYIDKHLDSPGIAE